MEIMVEDSVYNRCNTFIDERVAGRFTYTFFTCNPEEFS